MEHKIKKNQAKMESNYAKIVKDKVPVVLGNGSFAEVYLAQDANGTKVALKEINKQRIRNAGYPLSLVYSEVKIHRSLDHPNILKCLDFQEDSQTANIILEYVKGPNLYQQIRKIKKYSEEEARAMFKGIASAVAYMHSKDVVHRDMKPENILLHKGNIPKLCDFGWSGDCPDQRGTFCGTFEYLAPEIIREDSYGKEVDVWSLGILLYEMTHGFSPFRATSSDSVMTNICEKELSFAKSLSKELVNLIKSSVVTRNAH